MRWSAFSWGLQVTRFGVESTLITHALLVALEIALVATYPFCPAGPKVAHEARKPHSVFWLLRQNPAFTVMLLAILLGITGCLPMSNFLVNVVVSRGGTEGSLGAALFLMAAFELPTAFLFQRLYRRLGGGRLLLVSILFCFGKAPGPLPRPRPLLGVSRPAPSNAGLWSLHPHLGLLCQ